jgi:hypothetical protein
MMTFKPIAAKHSVQKMHFKDRLSSNGAMTDEGP